MKQSYQEVMKDLGIRVPKGGSCEVLDNGNFVNAYNSDGTPAWSLLYSVIKKGLRVLQKKTNGRYALDREEDTGGWTYLKA